MLAHKVQGFLSVSFGITISFFLPFFFGGGGFLSFVSFFFHLVCVFGFVIIGTLRYSNTDAKGRTSWPRKDWE